MKKDINFNALLDVFLDFGEKMLVCGGEINRTEDSIARMGKAYGATKTNVFVITSSIVVTMTFPQVGEITQTRRIHSMQSTDFKKLENLNGLSRKICKSPLSVSDFKAAIENIDSNPARKIKFYLGSAFASGGFAFFFGGNLADAAVSALLGLFICFFGQTTGRFFPNKVFYYFFCSLFTGILVCLCGQNFSILNADKIMIGDIMLLVPGIAITTAARDMLVGDTISGMQRLTESIIWAIALAGGFMASIGLMGGIA